MNQRDRARDYYDVIGAHKGASAPELERLYKRMAARLHPDRGGSEEAMKALNEAYAVLKDPRTRKQYDDARTRWPSPPDVDRASTPSAKDVGLLGHGLSSFLCLLMGVFLLVLVRSQWIWFLWPLAALALFVIGLGILMARSALRAFNMSLAKSNLLRRHLRLQEVAFWSIVVFSGYGVYLLLTSW